MLLEKRETHSECAMTSYSQAESCRVWKQVNAACVDKKEFRLAQICGLNLVVSAIGLYLC